MVLYTSAKVLSKWSGFFACNALLPHPCQVRHASHGPKSSGILKTLMILIFGIYSHLPTMKVHPQIRQPHWNSYRVALILGKVEAEEVPAGRMASHCSESGVRNVCRGLGVLHQSR